MACLLLFCDVVFFSFCFTQNSSLRSHYIFLYLFQFEVAGSHAEGHKKGNFSDRQENFFFGLKLYEIPSEIICFQNPKKFLQKADIVNPIININSKLEAVCV